MNRTTTVVVALIAAAGLSTMIYAIPSQHALAWGGFGGCGGGFGGCGGCGVGICGFFGDARLTCSYTDNVHDAIIYADCFGY
ncbi:MAG TPA: hypothetical protein VEL11_08435 [Candidatus Bathyarchaeia archaeon]|nr:hypothetical protein [Candidatus Bathyarchaeia archaeon]